MISIDSMVEVKLSQPDDFLKVKETLTRIGVASKKSNTLFQSCHILHKQGKYYITHFKELFALDGKPSDFTDEDRQRRNTISNLLEEWDLVSIVNPEITADAGSLSAIKVIPFNQKSEWELVAKYNIGKKK
jgi:hypothetical protein|tara:strand:- start:748 stop:1140 length:393 start_codon:yes stop_codon:yes gene_type:complete